MRISLSFFILFTFFNAYAQHQDVLPNESGDQLLKDLEIQYKPETVLDYGAARNMLYGKIDNKNGKLKGVYTGYEISVNPNGSSPKGEAFNKGINTEHTFPQSKGATGNAKSDMHHLFPTRIDVNGDRGHLPFRDIDDNITDNWYRLDYFGHSIPTSNIDEYSELDDKKYFEPREDHKGNVARAMMYFYTMYHDQADQADQGYFQGMIPTLCAWHYQDAVDPAEWKRTWEISKYQDGKPNPFVLDCTLATRSYCSNIDTKCTTANDDISNIKLYGIVPNPAYNFATIRYTLNQSAQGGNLEIYNNLGQIIIKKYIPNLRQGPNELPIDVSNLRNGFYIFVLKINGEKVTGKISVLK